MTGLRFAAFAILLALGLAACGENAGQDSAETQSSQTSDTLRVGVIALPAMQGNPYASLHAPTIYTWAAIFDSLTFVGNDGVVEPWLATSWEATSPTIWEFTLRDDVMFSNGEHFTADAVISAVDYPDGFDLVIEVVTGTAIPNGAAIFQKVAEDLRAVEVRVELKTFPLPQYFNAIHMGDFRGQGFMMDFPVYPQMDALRGLRLHSCLWKSPCLCVQDDQRLIEQAMAAPDMATRKALTRQLMRRYPYPPAAAHRR